MGAVQIEPHLRAGVGGKAVHVHIGRVVRADVAVDFEAQTPGFVAALLVRGQRAE